jgi:hypothetical protein
MLWLMATLVNMWVGVSKAGYSIVEKAPPATPSSRPGTNTGTLVFGGGVDTPAVLHVFRIPIGFRVEVRDFYSGLPSNNLKATSNLQNNLEFTGGLLIKFWRFRFSPNDHQSGSVPEQ